MAQPTVARNDLRYQIMLRLGMEFAKRYGESSAADSYFVPSGVAGSELVANPGFETGAITNWTLGTGWSQNSTAAYYHGGTKSAKYSASSISYAALTSDAFAVAELESYLFSLWLKIAIGDGDGSDHTETIRIEIIWLDVSSVVVRTDILFTGEGPTTWAQKSYTLVAPADATQAKVRIRGKSDASRTATFYVDDVSFASTAALPYIVDSSLVQSDDYWNGRWLLCLPSTAGEDAPAGDVRKVTDFHAASHALFIDGALSGVPDDIDFEYQLLDIYSPYEIHQAINDANREGAKTFFGVEIDEDTLVVKSNTLEYSLASISPTIWKIYNMWVEIPRSVIRGTATSATSTTLSDTAHNFETDGVEVGWRISIYDETGAGQVRTITAVSGSQITTAAWTTTPDSTSKYAVWNPAVQYTDWKQILGVRFDRQEYPSNFYLHARYEAYAGMRLRIQYSYKPSDMTDDDDTTPVLLEFLIPWAIKEMYEARSDSSKVDRSHYVSKIERLRVEAEQMRASSEMHEPAMSLWMYDEPNSGAYNGRYDDPLWDE